MKVKELKEIVANLPKEADEFDVIYGASGEEGLTTVDKVFLTYFEGEVPEDTTRDFLAIWSGDVK